MILSNLFLNNLEIQDNVLIVTQILTTMFLAILFIQSGIDKVIDKEGNLSWLKSHFSNSPLKNSIPDIKQDALMVRLKNLYLLNLSSTSRKAG